MGQPLLGKKFPFGLEVLDDIRIRLPDELAGPGFDLRCELPFLIHRLQEGKVISPAQLVVVLAESWRNMNDTCTVLGGDKLGAINLKGIIARYRHEGQ